MQILEFGVESHYSPNAPRTLQRPRMLSHAHNAAAIRAATHRGSTLLAPYSQARTAHAAAQLSQLAKASSKDGEGASAGGGHHVPAGWPTVGSTVHTLCTSNGSPYTNFQTRIMYATYQLAQKAPGGEIMAAFTRILHRSKTDELMQVCVVIDWCKTGTACQNCSRHICGLMP